MKPISKLQAWLFSIKNQLHNLRWRLQPRCASNGSILVITIVSSFHDPDYSKSQKILGKPNMSSENLDMDPSLNVLGEKLKPCSTSPMTGFFRDGCCNTSIHDTGKHTVCCQVTKEFLAFSKYLGNDLSTPRPEYGFAGLKDGDRWCLCADRWHQAHQEHAAPYVILESTHIKTLDVVALDVLIQKALDIN